MPILRVYSLISMHVFINNPIMLLVSLLKLFSFMTFFFIIWFNYLSENDLKWLISNIKIALTFLFSFFYLLVLFIILEINKGYNALNNAFY